MRILQIDDRPAAELSVQKTLKSAGIECDITFITAKEPTQVMAELPRCDELQGFDLALVDLELTDPQDPIGVEPEDLMGGHEVLPHLRREAPWLPVIGYSALFSSKPRELFLPVAGSFGFDGHLPKSFFERNRFTHKTWEWVTSQARLHRLRATVGDDSFSLRGNLVIDAGEQVRQLLDAKFGDWKPLLELCFHYADKVVIETLDSGFSGAGVYRVYTLQEEPASGEGIWLWKLSKSPAKLHEEALRHRRMLRQGLEHARAVPLLWRDVMVLDRLGCIAYQFATGTETALNHLRSHDVRSELVHVVGRIAATARTFHKSSRKDRATLGTLVQEWFNCPKLLRLTSRIERKGSKNKLTELLDGRESANNPVRYAKSPIHGDLHLSNVMLGERDLLIDFARSRPGPVALDIATIACDALIRFADVRADVLALRLDGGGVLGDGLLPLMQPVDWGEDDQDLIMILLQLLLLRALDYSDVDGPTKEWICSVL